MTFALGSSLPNPFIGRTLVSYAVPTPGRVELAIYDCSGMLVRTLHTGPEKAGNHQAVWTGSDEHGRQVAGGVYFCRLQSGNFTATKKMSKIE